MREICVSFSFVELRRQSWDTSSLDSDDRSISKREFRFLYSRRSQKTMFVSRLARKSCGELLWMTNSSNTRYSITHLRILFYSRYSNLTVEPKKKSRNSRIIIYAHLHYSRYSNLTFEPKKKSRNFRIIIYAGCFKF